MLKARSVFAFPLNFQPLRCEHFPERVVLGQVAPARVLARAHAAHDTGQLQLPQRFGVAAPVANAQQPLLRTPVASSHARTCWMAAIQPAISERREAGLA
jgi:hypothetical protein